MIVGFVIGFGLVVGGYVFGWLAGWHAGTKDTERRWSEAVGRADVERARQAEARRP
jgi:hypothetical protein